MGGSSYSGDVGARTRSTSREVFRTGADAIRDGRPQRRECHETLNPKGQKRHCKNCAEHPKTTPIVVAMDVTRSRGDDAKVIYGKLPMLIGQIIMKNYVSDPEISFAAIGDATSGDQAPIQIGQFESDNRLDEVLSNIWLEEGGGGTGQESYELTAYYYAQHSLLDCNAQGRKGYFFFVGDEGFYDKVAKDQIKVWIGDNVPDDIPTAQVFSQLQEKYHVFFIYPQKSWEQRKDDIDAEIKKRVESAGGMYQGVDIRASLMWNNTNDLDLHVIDPRRNHIYYGTNCRSNGRSPTAEGGYLDVDMNVHGETTKPVENTRWPKGKAPQGHYQVFVQNYAFHSGNRKATPFKVEIEINGKIQHFEGQTPAQLSGSDSDVMVYEFDYNPNERPLELAANAYEKYDDAVIKRQWAGVIPEEHILIIEDPKAIVDVLLGAITITEGTSDLEGYLVDMAGRGQLPGRRNETAKALTGLAAGKAIVKIDTNSLPTNGGKERKSKTARLS